MLDYYDLGVDILSARGYDLLGDAIDFGRYVIPLVREEVAKRDRAKAARPRSKCAGSGSRIRPRRRWWRN
ncbi:alkanesulfonate monooxygenase [Lentzea xinjiangensis]|uniref:Alkanesulfonate monooxygenase n=1 Tax=Lentzea xinjiangensis TaxID=402600 RepID=A0A1H9MQ35_9PSEU|nr:alkanesulfonate monooxygenase [Lentzea xinjiangensis]